LPSEGARQEPGPVTGGSSTPSPPRLSPEDQARVDDYLSSGINSVERKPFRPLLLLILLVVVVSGLSLLSLYLAESAGVY
jgi:hypothetical protein